MLHLTQGCTSSLLQELRLTSIIHLQQGREPKSCNAEPVLQVIWCLIAAIIESQKVTS